MRGRSSSSLGPLVAPTVRIVPSRPSERMDSSKVAGPTVSTTARAPAPPVAAWTALEKPSLGSATSAPSSRARSHLAASREVAITCRPCALANSKHAVATPPPIPTSTTQSPALSRPRVNSSRQAVSQASGSAAVSAIDR